MIQRPTSIMPIAVMAFALMSFILMVDLAISPRSKTVAQNHNHNVNQVACTDEAKICPDGSAVGRTGPNCAFAACPDANRNTNEIIYCAQDVKTCPNGSYVSRQPPSCEFEKCPSLTTYSVAEAEAQASTLNGQSICINGLYQNSFEFTAFGTGSRVDADGHTQLTDPYIWVSVEVPTTSLSCRKTDVVDVCQGQVTACGVFTYDPTGQAQKGHVGAYKYALDPATTVDGSNQLPHTTQ